MNLKCAANLSHMNIKDMRNKVRKYIKFVYNILINVFKRIEKRQRKTFPREVF